MIYKIAILIVTVVIAIKEIKEIADEDNGNEIQIINVVVINQTLRKTMFKNNRTNFQLLLNNIKEKARLFKKEAKIEKELPSLYSDESYLGETNNTKGKRKRNLKDIS